MTNTPEISIGMPVHNGGGYLRLVLDSLLTQTFSDYELLISDNASTDDTQAICLEYAARDSRIRYTRQATNIGAGNNFRFVLRQAKSRYFMWAAADDLRSEDFLECNHRFLATHPDYVASTSPTRFTGNDPDGAAMGDRALEQATPHERVAAFFGEWHANGLFYSLIQREAILDWPCIDEDFLGADWTLVTHLASHGKLARQTQGWVELGRHGASNRKSIFAQYRTSWLGWLMPFHALTSDSLRHMLGAPAKLKWRVFLALARLNLHAFLIQIRFALASKD